MLSDEKGKTVPPIKLGHTDLGVQGISLYSSL